MAINKVDINLTNALNEDNIDGSYGAFIPKNRYAEFSDYLSQNLNIYEKTVGVKNPRCKVVKVIEGTGFIPQVASYSWTRTNTQELSTNNMRIIQAKVICPNGPRGVVPYPSDVINPSIENQDPFITSLHTTAFLEFDSTKNQFGLAPLDEVIIEYVGNDRSEAKILEIFRINNRTPQSNETNPQTAFNNSDGTTVSDAQSNTTGDVTQDNSNNALSDKPTGKCGIKGNTTYPLEDCKTAKFDANGQMATLHPLFWDKVNKLLNKIKEAEGVTIPHSETIRSQQKQYGYRLKRCPDALQKLGEKRFRTEPWDVLKANGPCLNNDDVGAVEGAYASNHLKGLAIDFTLGVPCSSIGKNRSLYERCRATSLYFKLLTKYASEFSVINLTREPWHWSFNGR